MKIPYNLIFNFIKSTCRNYSLDESHGLKHSMEVFQYAQQITNCEKTNLPYIKNQEHIIYTSALLHDMCDKKYMDEMIGIGNIKNFIKNDLHYNNEDNDIICEIISTMSYSKVKKDGFPELKEYQHAYNIVRESDLLSAYDIDRCIIYNMDKLNLNYLDSIKEAISLYDIRMGKYIKDDLFKTTTGLNLAKIKNVEAMQRIELLKELL